MGDISAEPSMEEILSSIKRIIAEEEAPTGRRRAGGRPAATPAPARDDEDDVDEVLELSDPIPAAADPAPLPRLDKPAADPMPLPRFGRAAAEPVAPLPSLAPEPVAAPAELPTEPIVSAAAADATRGALASLTKKMHKADPQPDGPLEGVVRDMLRPMLKEWLDAHLPDMVEAMVAREIKRIAGAAD